MPCYCIPQGEYLAKGLSENLWLKFSKTGNTLLWLRRFNNFHSLDWNLEYAFLAFYSGFYDTIRVVPAEVDGFKVEGTPNPPVSTSSKELISFQQT